MNSNLPEEKLGKNMPIGANHYRAFVGPPEKYDLVGAMQFNLLTTLGLREDHYLLDIGCGSLRAGKLLLVYLLPGRYCGIEPERWLIEEGIRNELGNEIIQMKKPIFSHDKNFNLTSLNQKFDFILAQSIFSHAAEKQIKKCLSEAKKIMKPETIFTATFVKGEENFKGNEWVYPDCVTYTLSYFKRMVEEEDLACIPLNWYHPNNQTWVAIVNKGSEGNLNSSIIKPEPVADSKINKFLKKNLKILFRKK